jgi:ABC-type Mn2+/Zn2+ transport system permease subunit
MASMSSATSSDRVEGHVRRGGNVAFCVSGENDERGFGLSECLCGEIFAVTREKVHNSVVTHENAIHKICTFWRPFFIVSDEQED